MHEMSSKFKLLFKNPRLFIEKLHRVMNDLVSYYFPEKNVIDFINHNKKTWKTWKMEGNPNLILFDYYTLAETEVARSYLLNILAKKYKAGIASYSFNDVRRSHWKKIYRSYNVARHVTVKLNNEQKERSRAIFNEIIPGIKTKRDVFTLRVFGVWIGVDVYEEYLMRYTEPTIILGDPRYLEIMREGIEALVFWKDFFEANNVKAIVSSHIGARIERNLPCKIAGQLFNIPFYSTHARSMTYYPEPHLYHEEIAKRYKSYHERYKTLPLDVQKQGIEWAKKQLKRRLSGEVGIDISYSTKSAFVYNPSASPVLIKNEKIKVLICPHEFYDSPNCYGGLLFMDFYEWLMFLGDISEKTDYDWYVKVHPDAIPKSKEIIENIVARFPRFRIIPSQTPFQQLAIEGVNFVLTCYGSVGHECPLLGMQVINAGNNPHMGYGFNWHPETLEEYENMLLNLESLQKEINFDDIYEFYFMNYKEIGIIDGWIYASYSKMLTDLTEQERFCPAIFPYFLKQLTPQRHQEIISRFAGYIDSGKIGSATVFDFKGIIYE